MRDVIEQALAHHRAGRLGEAEALYRGVLDADAAHAGALHLLGVICLQTGRVTEAESLLGRAVAAQPTFPEAQNNLGNALKVQGRLVEAEACYRLALSQRSDFPEALNNMGVCLAAAGQPKEALSYFDAALALRPDYPEAVVGRLMVLERLERLEEAADAYVHAVRLLPHHADLANGQGNLLRRLGRLEEAASAYGSAVAARPDFAEFHVNLGLVQTERQQAAAARASLERALELDPGHIRAGIGLGIALGMEGRSDEAVSVLRSVVAAAPDFPPAHGNLGLLLMRTGQLDAAEACQRQAIALQPGYAVAHNNLAQVLMEQGRPAEALESVDRAMALAPGLFEAFLTRATALKVLQRQEEAETTLRAALELRPQDPEARNSLGAVLLDIGRLDEAVALFRGILEGHPDSLGVRINLANTLLTLGRASEAFEQYQITVDAQPDIALPQRYRLYCAMYRDDLDVGDLARLHKEFGAAMAKAPLPSPPLPARVSVPRLRVGYLSSDFRNHPVTTNLLPILRCHDRSAVEIHCYAHVVVPDTLTQAVKDAADAWHDIRGLSDEETAAKIRADGIHILVSLAGRFDQNRPQVCAYRAAPIQITTHDTATSGLAEMDYMIGDGVLMPSGGKEYFSERPLRLPSFYIAERPNPDALARIPLPPSPRTGAPVLICLNNPAKITDARLRLWGRILAARPDASLILKFHQAYQAVSLRDRVKRLVTDQGAKDGQIRMIGDRDTPDGFMLRYNQADIALDTGPFCGSTTTFQALCMGVPVITLPEDRMVGRWGASMLRAVGLNHMVARDEDDYAALALKAMDDVEQWRSCKSDIRGRLLASRLCAPDRWARHLERLYRAVWRRHCARSQAV